MKGLDGDRRGGEEKVEAVQNKHRSHGGFGLCGRLGIGGRGVERTEDPVLYDRDSVSIVGVMSQAETCVESVNDGDVLEFDAL